MILIWSYLQKIAWNATVQNLASNVWVLQRSFHPVQDFRLFLKNSLLKLFFLTISYNQPRLPISLLLYLLYFTSSGELPKRASYLGYISSVLDCCSVAVPSFPLVLPPFSLPLAGCAPITIIPNLKISFPMYANTLAWLLSLVSVSVCTYRYWLGGPSENMACHLLGPPSLILNSLFLLNY